QVGLEILHRLEVVSLAVELRVCDKDHSVCLMQDQLHRGIVNDLAWDSVELKADFVAGNGGSFEGQKIKKQGAIAAGRKRHEITGTSGIQSRVDCAKVGRFATQRGAAIDDLKGDEFLTGLNDWHC